MASSTALYDNLPLDSSKSEIRLLIIESSEKFDSPLVCKLGPISLNKEPLSFRALSYCWGPLILSKAISCNNEKIYITSSLYNALRRVRHLFCHMLQIELCAIWVDGICVNQLNLAERSSQVLLMKEIYMRCDFCLCYIGEEDESTDLALAYAESLHKENSILPAFAYSEIPILDMVRGASRDGRDAFIRLLQRDYFTRIWVIQEFTVSKRRLVLCGSRSFYWETLNTVVLEMDEESRTDPSENRHHISPVISRLKTFVGFQQLWKWLNDPLSSQGERSKATTELTLIRLAQRASGFNATDPRDKIFALRGIAIDGDQFPAPDYSLSVEEVYQSFAESLCRRGSGLELIQYGTGVRKSLLTLPSWVPDWSCTTPPPLPTLFEQQTSSPLSRSARSQEAIMLGPVAKVLTASCHRLGVIDALASSKTHENVDGDYIRDHLFSVRDLLASMAVDKTEDRSLWASVYNILTHNGLSFYSQTGKIPDHFPGLFSALMEDVEQGRKLCFTAIFMGDETGVKELDMEHRKMIDLPCNTLETRRIALLNKTVIAVVPQSTRVGDVIVYFRGALAPCVVHNIRSVAFQYVGSAYVQGMMDPIVGESELETILIL